MNDTIRITNSDVSFVKFPPFEKYNPRNVCVSESGFIAVMFPDNIFLGVISYKPFIDAKQFMFHTEKLNLNFHTNVSVVPVADFDFEEAITGHKTNDETVLHLLLDEEFTVPKASEKFNIKYTRIEWSPKHPTMEKEFLAIMKGDGRIYLVAYDVYQMEWRQEFDITDLYHIYYIENILVCPCSQEGKANCAEAAEYIRLKLDLKPIDFSWSSTVRVCGQRHYFLMALVTLSGVLTIWRIEADNCSLVYRESLETKTGTPLFMKFCDVSPLRFMIVIAYSDERIITKPYKITNTSGLNNDCPDVIIDKAGKQANLAHQRKHNTVNKLAWSQKHMQLLIGYGSELFSCWFQMDKEKQLSHESAWIDLSSDCEVTGIFVHTNHAYITTFDGALYGLKLDSNIDNLELNPILFDHEGLSNGNNEFYDVFVSQNGVFVGLLRCDTSEIVRTGKGTVHSDIVMFRALPEAQILNLLMNDTQPFGTKSDAIQDMKFAYFNKKSLLNASWAKFLATEPSWKTSTLYTLQLIRYFFVFFGYNLNRSLEFISEETQRSFDLVKIRKLEFLMMQTNLSHWLERFCELTKAELDEQDCLLVLSIVSKLDVLPPDSCETIAGTMKTATSRAKLCLNEFFNYDQQKISDCLSQITELRCPRCTSLCDFNLFWLHCSKGHKLKRCIKTLELCADKHRQCLNCGASELAFDLVNTNMSNWRKNIMLSRCPLCDGRFGEITST